MVSTVDMDELAKHADNIYEAIIMIARRARQINDEQKAVMDKEVGYDEDSEDFDDEEIEHQVAPKTFLKFPKPPTEGLKELLDGGLQMKYVEEKVS